MKRAQSILIEQFLRDVKSGLIVGLENSSGPIALREIADALQKILNGADTDKALGIERLSGAGREWKTIALALLIHEHRKVKEKWAVVELIANDWLLEQGFEPVSQRRLSAIYKDNLEWLQRRDFINDMVKRTQQAIQKHKQKQE